MPINRRNFILVTSVLLCIGGGVQAQEAFPAKPIKIIAPFAPGSSDVIARRLGEHAGKTLGQPIVVENRPGRQGTVASRAVAKAKNDGYTLLLGTNSTHAASVHMFKELGYDPVKDFTPIIRFSINPLVLVVNAEMPVRTLKEFIKYAKERPGKLSYGMGNSGSLVAAQMLKTQAGIDAVGVNYPGNAQAVSDFVGGRLDFMVTDPLIVKPFVQTGKLRILGLTSKQRLATLPDVVPMAEQGLPNYEYVSWVGLFGPAGMPPDVTRRLHDAFAKALAEPDTEKFLAGMGMITAGASPAEFGAYVQDQIKVWGRLTKDAGLLPQ
ncbi:Bug family tripartite tricarboxylate transporter substrate binding protein [Noviherbaspirillum sedimenti]|uniref:Tripartite tricarboxylate transporter substrate binding protein n=1 Tax=Noviherbaspirillum sedimenti TaxID=2320865 RepID=A0A3A3G992_9BURK|nr:tripartite tricarboxylate transporter substrate binding protein [Noviherbaspirillum sedimenti]RJG03309.1 tripartite tricarboxylate transporter substrate binding protein [Noviherbaspirillum sedimenti]